MTRALILALALASLPAAAKNPPAVGSEQHEMLSPHSEWIRSARNPAGEICCNEGDGRVVRARTRGDAWEVLFDGEEGFPAGWQTVPAASVLRGANPSGMPVAWWYGGIVRCFAPVSGG